jgi:hypothetical protein
VKKSEGFASLDRLALLKQGGETCGVVDFVRDGAPSCA